MLHAAPLAALQETPSLWLTGTLGLSGHLMNRRPAVPSRGAAACYDDPHHHFDSRLA